MTKFELEVRRIIRAERARVFEAWTTPALLMKWWGPAGISCPGAEVDLRVGGAYRIGNLTADGKELWISGTFEHVEPPESLVYSWTMNPDDPEQERVSVRFIAATETTTEIIIHHERLSTEESVAEHHAGWLGCIDGLEALLTEPRSSAARPWHNGAPPPLKRPELPKQVTTSTHPPRILMLYGSLRERSYSRLLAEEAARILEGLGAEVKWFHSHELPLKGAADEDHPKVQELRDLSIWSEGQVWSSPEMHGNITGVFKNQIDWIPLSIGSVRPTQGRTVAVMQVCGGSQSFNTVNTLRILGRWMRMLTIPNQSSVAKAYNEFHNDGRMMDSPFRDRVVDVMEELYRFTLLTRDIRDSLVDRYSERREAFANAPPDPNNPQDRIGREGL